jgi:hypothetical protein
MININKKKLNEIRGFIYKNGRLLERKLFSFFFEEGIEEDVINYNNVDKEVIENETNN